MQVDLQNFEKLENMWIRIKHNAELFLTISTATFTKTVLQLASVL